MVSRKAPKVIATRCSGRRHDNITVDPIGPGWCKRTMLFLPTSDWPSSTSQVDHNPFEIPENGNLLAVNGEIYNHRCAEERGIERLLIHHSLRL